MALEPRDDLVRRLAAAIRGATLYSISHPIVQRGIDAFAALCAQLLQQRDALVVGFIGDEVVVDDARLARSGASLVGFVRDLHEKGIEKITFSKGVTRDEIRNVIVELADRSSTTPLQARLDAKDVRRIALGRIVVEETDSETPGIAAARKVYGTAVATAEQLWAAAKAGDKPDPAAARKIIDSLAKLVNQDRTSLMALTALKKYDNYTFTHMVNVSVLSMAQARSLNLEGPLLREFGFAALMHDIGKVNTPLEILNKPDKLTPDEFTIMKRHVVEGAHILRRTPQMPALAPVVAFEHHLKADLSGYPEKVGSRQLNLCTMIVAIADVYDALRSTRVYREGMPTDRVKAIMARQNSTEFNPTLLRRFINLMGMFPIGTLVRLNTEDMAVVTHEHPTDPFRPQVKVVFNRLGERIEEPFLLNTWERDDRGDYAHAVVEAVDPETMSVDPLTFL